MCCQSTIHAYHSDEWPSVILCYQCILAITGWLWKQGMADNNPFFLSLVDGVWPRERFKGNEFQVVWIRNGDGSMSSHRIKLSEGLDIQSEVC